MSGAPDQPARAVVEDLQSPVAGPALQVRSLRTHEEYLACVDLQRETWGEQFSERVPSSLLQVCQRIGGVTAGAFDGDGLLVGFVFGITGVENGRCVHWSDMLAVKATARGLGIGRRLKEFQRDRLREIGVEVVYWTYDPLVARNAHLNLSRLGAEVVEYVRDMYGDSDSVLHRGLGTDRLVVAWRIGAGDERPAAPSGFEDAPILGAAAGAGGLPALPDATDTGPVLRVEIPPDIQEIKACSPEEAMEWRRSTRAAFLWALGRGYRIRGFYRDAATERCFYVVSRHERTSEGA
jgi:predicted GNAT superfamily acetyltransferase